MSDVKILIVEDEPKVASFIKEGLENNAYTATVATDGIAGKELAIGQDFDLIILDINLPKLNGFEVCKEIRKTKNNVPILMLTAMDTTEDKLIGFDSGADYYLVKPFEFRELTAIIKALLKRSQTSSTPSGKYSIADLELDTESKVVKRDNQKIDLTAKEFALLEYFLKNKGRVISRAEIAEKIWDITFDTGTNVIDVYINFLRKKIDKGHPIKLIHTLIGMGYVLKISE